jgi:hypothetical protein
MAKKPSLVQARDLPSTEDLLMLTIWLDGETKDQHLIANHQCWSLMGEWTILEIKDTFGCSHLYPLDSLLKWHIRPFRQTTNLERNQYEY